MKDALDQSGQAVYSIPAYQHTSIPIRSGGGVAFDFIPCLPVPILETLPPLHLPDFLTGASAELFLQVVDVVAGVGVVLVGYLGQVVHLSARQLKHRVVHRVVNRVGEKLSPRVPEYSLRQQQKQVAPACPQVTVVVPLVPVPVAGPDLLRVLSADSHVQTDLPLRLQVVGVEGHGLQAPVGLVDGSEDLSADEFVVPVDHHEYLSLLAVLVSCPVDVFHVVLPFAVADESDLLPGQRVGPQFLL